MPVFSTPPFNPFAPFPERDETQAATESWRLSAYPSRIHIARRLRGFSGGWNSVRGVAVWNVRCIGRLVVRFRPVIGMNLVLPHRVGHIRPFILIEPRCGFQPFFVDIEYKALVHVIGFQRFPGYGEKLVADSQKSPEGEHGVCYGTRFDV